MAAERVPTVSHCVPGRGECDRVRVSLPLQGGHAPDTVAQITHHSLTVSHLHDHQPPEATRDR
jgi:hypothetical protein